MSSSRLETESDREYYLCQVTDGEKTDSYSKSRGKSVILNSTLCKPVIIIVSVHETDTQYLVFIMINCYIFYKLVKL